MCFYCKFGRCVDAPRPPQEGPPHSCLALSVPSLCHSAAVSWPHDLEQHANDNDTAHCHWSMLFAFDAVHPLVITMLFAFDVKIETDFI